MDEFQTALQQAKLELEPAVEDRLRDYCRLLWERNTQLNLTRHTTFSQFVFRDLLDTWHLARQLEPGEVVLDVGSGGGVPGLVLAILRPDLKISLSDSVKKKARCLQEFAQALQLDVEIYDSRAESLLEDFRYDSTIARAVGPLAKLLPLFRGRWLNAGRLLLIKGPRWSEEQAAARQANLWSDRELRLQVLAEYPIPGEEWHSFLLEIRKRTE